MLPAAGWLVGYVACGKADKRGVAKDEEKRGRSPSITASASASASASGD